MLQPGRKTSSGLYRYGFNGKEADNEVKGEGAQQDYGMRIYDPRVGRFLSVDPIANEFPWNSTYSYAEGDPVNYIDLDGLEKPDVKAQASVGVTTRSKYKVVSGKSIAQRTAEQAAKKGGSQLAKKAGQHWLIRGVSWLGSKAAGLTLGAVLSDGELASGDIDPEYKKKMEEYLKRKALEQVTTDPSKLSNEYLAEVEKRIKDGTATLQDYQYQDEIAKRKKEGRIDTGAGNQDKNTYSLLSNKEIEKLQEKFGEGDPDFIEKIKKPGGKGAGKVDLYKNDKTGEVVVIPKAQEDKNKGGEPTGYNVKQLK